MNAVPRLPAPVRPVRNRRTDLAPGDRVSVRRHPGAQLEGTMTAVGDWEPSCAGTPMRWIDFTTDDGTRHFVADTPHRDNDVTRVTLDNAR